LVHCTHVHPIVFESASDSGLDCLRASAVEQPAQSRHGTADVSSPFGDGLQKYATRRSSLREAVHGPVLSGCTLLLHQLLDVRWILHLLASTPRAPMAGNNL